MLEWVPCGSTDANFNTGTYLYDGTGNITDIGNDIFNYDSVSRLVYGTAQGGAYSEENTYDAFGNRIVASSMGLTRTNPVNPLTNRLTGASYRPISYDGAGNMTQWGTADYTYDELHMQTGLEDTNDNEYYLYTADDERIAVIEANSSNSQTSARWMLRDFGNQLVRSYDQGTFNSALTWDKDYIRRDGQMLARKLSSGAIEHAHLDHLGTPRYWTKTNASAAQRHDYLPFGEEVTFPTLDPEPMQFTGHERDGHLSGGCGSGITGVNNQTLSTGQQITGCDEIRSENTTVTSTAEVRFTAGEKIVLKEGFNVANGAHFVAEIDGNLQAERQDLDYMHARYCSPYLGRFSAFDPSSESEVLSMPQSWNKYSYVLNNPLVYIDPYGELWFQVGGQWTWLDDTETIENVTVNSDGTSSTETIQGLESLATFDGSTLTLFQNGGSTQSFEAVAGKPFTFGDPSSFQGQVNIGPIPEGVWSFNPGQVQAYSSTSLLDRVKGFFGGGTFRGGTDAWGEERVWLTPEPSTNTRGRSGFTIHGGTTPGSRGCIDLCSRGPDFFSAIDRTLDKIPVYVDYSGGE